MFSADQDLLDPGHRPVCVEGEVPEAEKVTQAMTPLGCKEQAGMLCSEQGRVAQIELCPGKRERLCQLAGQVTYRAGVDPAGGPDPDL